MLPSAREQAKIDEKLSNKELTKKYIYSVIKKGRWHSQKPGRLLISLADIKSKCLIVKPDLIKDRDECHLMLKYTVKSRIVLNLPSPYQVKTRNPVPGCLIRTHKGAIHNLCHPIPSPMNYGLEGLPLILYC